MATIHVHFASMLGLHGGFHARVYKYSVSSHLINLQTWYVGSRIWICELDANLSALCTVNALIHCHGSSGFLLVAARIARQFIDTAFCIIRDFKLF